MSITADDATRRHGGPYDRGAMDSYYGRPPSPHYFAGGSHKSQLIIDLTPEEIEAYHEGYDDNERDGNRKDFG